jgi:hypothetical protein
MGKSAEQSSGGSSRQYERLLKGEITSKQYVQSLRKEADSQVARQRTAMTGRYAKRSSEA